MNSMVQSDIKRFLKDYPGMELGQAAGKFSLIFTGVFAFEANYYDAPTIIDEYRLRIKVPSGFPKSVPIVEEIDGKIPRDENNHVFPDGSLCLGSPFQLFRMLTKRPSLVGFAEECIVPFLYSISMKRINGGEFLFGELTHGCVGILEDYIEYFGISGPQVIHVLKLLGEKRRVANKRLCPCGCGKLLRDCRFKNKIDDIRKIAPSSFFRNQLKYAGLGLLRACYMNRDLAQTPSVNTLRPK